MTASTRLFDPSTSHYAATTVDMPKAQTNVWELFRAGDTFTDEQLFEKYVEVYGTGSESGVRTRRSELTAAGFVECVDHQGTTKGGRQCRRYRKTR